MPLTTHTHPFNSPMSGTTPVSRYQKGKTNLDFTEARDSEWQWYQLGHMQVCTSLHASNPPLSFLQAGCPSCCPTNSVKALKALNSPRKFNATRTKICYCVLPKFSRGYFSFYTRTDQVLSLPCAALANLALR